MLVNQLKQVIQGWFVTPNYSLVVSEITTSKGLFLAGDVEYFPVGHRIKLYIDLKKNSKNKASWIVRELKELTNSSVIDSGLLEKNMLSRYLTLEYTPKEPVPTQIELEVTSGKTTIKKHLVIQVRENCLSEAEKNQVENFRKAHLNIQADIVLRKRLDIHLKDVTSAIDIINQRMIEERSKGNSTSSFQIIKNDLILFTKEIKEAINDNAA